LQGHDQETCDPGYALVLVDRSELDVDIWSLELRVAD
jgi:hypothetical protein